MDEPDHSAGKATIKKKGQPPIACSGKDYIKRCDCYIREKEPVNKGHNPPKVGRKTHHAREELSEMLTDCTAYIPDMFKNPERAATKDHHV
jgi:hypothetical protein